MEKKNRPIETKIKKILNRFKSLFLEHFITCYLILPPIIIVSFFTMTSDINSSSNQWLFYVVLFLYLNKDITNGQSITKRILGTKVIDIKTGKIASQLQCFVRNFTIPLWPLEVLFSIISPSRRIGDFIAGTRIIEAEKSKWHSFFSDFKSINITKDTASVLLIGIVIMLLFHYLVIERIY
jgi:uncharacterized RDD family membrane protein YckC